MPETTDNTNTADHLLTKEALIDQRDEARDQRDRLGHALHAVFEPSECVDPSRHLEVAKATLVDVLLKVGESDPESGSIRWYDARGDRVCWMDLAEVADVAEEAVRGDDVMVARHALADAESILCRLDDEDGEVGRAVREQLLRQHGGCAGAGGGSTPPARPSDHDRVHTAAAPD